jgi:hypothetical protein
VKSALLKYSPKKSSGAPGSFCTVMKTGLEVLVLPMPSVATAVSVNAPRGRSDHVTDRAPRALADFCSAAGKTPP